MDTNTEITVLSTIDKRRAALAKARAAKKESGAGLTRKNTTEQWKENKTSLRLSINAKCFDCSNYQKEEVTNCSVRNCPLWLVRPFQKGTEQ